mmetsp:Transcript_10578/g.15789  ORF Transcript_10578/g.15789 Transcript_10578/m.15789 type:complete len:102 (+) Transcript_10578:264-569(+)
MVVVSFLLLDDGDFTYSLDLARYLVHNTANEKHYQLIATGIDRKDQLVTKYKDSPFVLQQLQSISSSTSNNLSVHIVHGVNAIMIKRLMTNCGNKKRKPKQ